MNQKEKLSIQAEAYKKGMADMERIKDAEIETLKEEDKKYVTTMTEHFESRIKYYSEMMKEALEEIANLKKVQWLKLAFLMFSMALLALTVFLLGLYSLHLLHLL